MESNEQSKQEVVSMSIETDLNRIATSLEEIVKCLRSNAGNKIAPAAAPVPAATETLGGKKGKSPTAQPAPVIYLDEITGQPVPAAQLAATAPQPTLDEVHVQLRLLKDNPQGGIEACKKLMIEFGADKARTVISSIPPANYAALIAKIGTLL